MFLQLKSRRSLEALSTSLCFPDGLCAHFHTSWDQLHVNVTNFVLIYTSNIGGSWGNLHVNVTLRYVTASTNRPQRACVFIRMFYRTEIVMIVGTASFFIVVAIMVYIKRRRAAQLTLRNSGNTSSHMGNHGGPAGMVHTNNNHPISVTSNMQSSAAYCPDDAHPIIVTSNKSHQGQPPAF